MTQLMEPVCVCVLRHMEYQNTHFIRKVRTNLGNEDILSGHHNFRVWIRVWYQGLDQGLGSGSGAYVNAVLRDLISGPQGGTHFSD